MTRAALKETSLFQPLQVGDVTLKHRVSHLPTTRMRATSEHVPTDLQLKYYEDRASVPGTLLVTEATFISEEAGLYAKVPGIWSEAQTQAWKKIVDAVHAKGSYISLQLWALGRTANPALLKERGHRFVGPSALYVDEKSKKDAETIGNPIHALTEDEVRDYVYRQYDNAARNAASAGFDFVEVHAANGYLLEQFLNPSSNQRTDKYGGSVENHARFALEVVDHIVSILGASKVGIRLSPYINIQGLRGEDEPIHPIVLHGYLLDQLQRRAASGKQLAYVSIVDRVTEGEKNVHFDIGFIQKIWKGILLRGGSYTDDDTNWSLVAKTVGFDDRTLVGFGRHFIANPDLVERLAHGHDLNSYDRSTFYSDHNYGYNTYGWFGEDNDVNKEKELKRVGVALA